MSTLRAWLPYVLVGALLVISRVFPEVGAALKSVVLVFPDILGEAGVKADFMPLYLPGGILVAVVAATFFLHGMKQIGTYVSLFAVGHSTTMLAGVYFGVGINSYLIDAIIGFSVAYKALDNLGAYPAWFGVQPDPRTATLIFGFLHGFGLASKIIDYNISPDGLVPNLLAFNVGVEVGQLLALAAILAVMRHWRRLAAFPRQAYAANVVMMTLGFVLMGYQLAGATRVCFPAPALGQIDEPSSGGRIACH